MRGGNSKLLNLADFNVYCYSIPVIHVFPYRVNRAFVALYISNSPCNFGVSMALFQHTRIERVETCPAELTLMAYFFLVFRRCNGSSSALKPAVCTIWMEVSVVKVWSYNTIN